MDNNDFCCTALKDRIENAGSKGFAIIPVKNPFKADEYAYFLQSRNVDESDDTSRHTIIDTGILYCPWCGTKLTEVTRMNKEAIAAIAEKNRNLIRV